MAWSLLFVWVVVTLAAAVGVPGRATDVRQTSGDEPHYLVTAISLAQGGDLDVADEYADGRYRPFHAPDLSPQGSRGDDGRIVEPHDPLLPTLLALPVALGDWAAAKGALAVIAGLTAAVTAWTMVKRFGVRLWVAAGTASVFGASAPLAVYGQQIYPEIPAALAVVVVVAALTQAVPRRLVGAGTGHHGFASSTRRESAAAGDHAHHGRHPDLGTRSLGHRRSTDGVSPASLVAAGLGIVTLPWLSVKYVPLAAILAGLVLWPTWRGGQRREAFGFVVALTLAGVAYLGLHVAWYGGPTVYAAGQFFQAHGGQSSVFGVAPDWLGRSTRLLGLLVDREFGIAAWQPAWLLAVPALAGLARRRPAGWTALAGPIAVAWLAATFVAATMHGWWFPGRQVVVGLPLVTVAVGWWIDGAPTGRQVSRGRLIALGALGVFGVVTYVWLVAETWSGASNWIVDFAATSNPWYRIWRLALPNYRLLTVGTWIRHTIWIAVLATLGVWAWRNARSPLVSASKNTP